MSVEAFAAAFDGDPTAIVVATTTERKLLVDIVQERRPTICLIDIDRTDPSCVDTLARLMQRTPSTAVVVLVDDPPPAFVRALIKAGVRGFIRKDANLRHLRRTIDRVCATRAVVGADVVRVRPRVAPRTLRSVPTTPRLDRLTVREQEVLNHIIAGEDTRRIATALHISRSTARTHVQNVRRKLGARTKLQVVAVALGTAKQPASVGVPAWSYP